MRFSKLLAAAAGVSSATALAIPYGLMHLYQEGLDAQTSQARLQLVEHPPSVEMCKSVQLQAMAGWNNFLKRENYPLTPRQKELLKECKKSHTLVENHHKQPMGRLGLFRPYISEESKATAVSVEQAVEFLPDNSTQKVKSEFRFEDLIASIPIGFKSLFWLWASAMCVMYGICHHMEPIREPTLTNEEADYQRCSREPLPFCLKVLLALYALPGIMTLAVILDTILLSCGFDWNTTLMFKWAIEIGLIATALLVARLCYQEIRSRNSTSACEQKHAEVTQRSKEELLMASSD